MRPLLRAFSAILLLSGILALVAETPVREKFLRNFLPTAAPLSIAAHRARLMPCIDDALSLERKLQTSDLRHREARRCLRLAASSRRALPGFAEADMAEATARYVLGDRSLAARALVRCAEAAPMSGWLAVRRVRLAVMLDGDRPQALQAAVARDLEMMAREPAYLGQLVAWYRAWSPRGRERLVHALDTAAPTDVARAFLRHLSDSGGAS